MKIGDWIRSELTGLRGQIIGEGLAFKLNIPCWRVDIGGGRTSAIAKVDAELWFTEEETP